jgi:endonuclease/exonuclease/phosphatase family metal-dependent hydrolase
MTTTHPTTGLAGRRLRLGRRLAAGTVSVATLALLGAVAPVGTTSANAAQTDLLVGSYNIRAGVSTGDFESAVHSLTQTVDVAGLQEVNSHAKEAVLGSLRSAGFGYYRPKPGEQSPVIWRTSRFTFLSGRVQSIADKAYVGDEISPKYVYVGPVYATVVHLQDRQTGEKVSVVNTHLPPGACINGGPQPSRPREFQVFRRSVINLGHLADSEKSFGRLFVLGDFNIGYAADKRVGRTHLPYKTFGRLGMSSMWATEVPSGKRGSHVNSPSLIDQVYSGTQASNATVRFDVGYSDHFPVIARYLVG